MRFNLTILQSSDASARHQSYPNWKDIHQNQQSLLQKSRQSTLIQSFKTKIQEKMRKKNILFFHNQQIQQRKLKIKRLELISDPIYTCSAPQSKQQQLQRIIIKYTTLTNIIQPQNKKLIIWNIVMTIVILYYFFQIGLVLFFGRVVWDAELNYWWSYLFNCFSILALSFDILVTLNRGFYLKGILINSRKEIYQNYFRYQFVIDIGSIFLVCLTFISGKYDLIYLKIFFLFKLNNLNIIDLTFQRILQFNPLNNAIYLVFRLILVMIMICHYLGGIYYAMDVYIYQTNYYGPNTPNMSWVYVCVAYPQMIILQPWFTQYLYTMYWAIATITTIAYGDITPVNPIQTIYVMFMLIISCITFAYIINNIIQILIQVRASENTYIQSLASLNQYMKLKLITNKLQMKIRGYFQFIWNQQGERFRNIQLKMIQNLPNQLKEQLLSGVYREFLDDLLIYRLYPTSIIPLIVAIFDQYRSSKGQVLCDPSGQQRALARYLVNGQITLYLNSIKIQKITKGSIGILELYKDTKQGLLIKTTKDSLLYYIKRQFFMNIINKNHIYIETFRYIADRLHQRLQAETLGISCFMCNEENHLCKRCPFSHYIPNKYVVINKWYNRKQKRMEKKRILRDRLRFLRSDKLKEICQYFSFKYQRIWIKDIQLKQQNIQYLLDLETKINDKFNQIKDYIDKTENIVKYLKQKIIYQYQSQILNLDKRQDYTIYFPQYNLSNIINSIDSESNPKIRMTLNSKYTFKFDI